MCRAGTKTPGQKQSQAAPISDARGVARNRKAVELCEPTTQQQQARKVVGEERRTECQQAFDVSPNTSVSFFVILSLHD